MALTKGLLIVLNTTGLQQKDNRLYQVIQDLIKNLADAEDIISTLSTSSASSSTGITQLTGDVLAGPGSGSVVSTLSTTGVVAGTYGSSTAIPIITFDAKGRATTATTVSFTGGTGITQLTGDVLAGPGSGSVVSTLSTTGVTAGTYGGVLTIPIITVDDKGRITTASTTTFTTGGGTGSGVVAKISSVFTTATSTGTTIIPFDNTRPLNTEGTQFMSLSYTPTTSTNRLKINVQAHVSLSLLTSWAIGALFIDASTSSLAAGASFINTATAWVPVVFAYDTVAGTTSALSFTFRAGCNTNATVTFNGQAGAQIFGGSLYSFIVVEEYTP